MNAIIIDNAIQSCEGFTRMLKTYCPGIEIIGNSCNMEHGTRLIRDKKPQLIFIHVEMPDMDGVEVLRRYGPPESEVIFLAEHHGFAAQAFEMNALDYLIRPFSGERLIVAVTKAFEQYQRKHLQQQYELLLDRIHQQGNPVESDTRIAFSMLNEIVFSWMRNIIWVEANASMCFVRVSDHPKELYIAKNIGEYVKLFSDYPDLKLVHRSHLTNRNHVKRYLREENALEMSDGKHIPVSTERRGEVLDWLGLH